MKNGPRKGSSTIQVIWKKCETRWITDGATTGCPDYATYDGIFRGSWDELLTTSLIF